MHPLYSAAIILASNQRDAIRAAELGKPATALIRGATISMAAEIFTAVGR